MRLSRSEGRSVLIIAKLREEYLSRSSSLSGSQSFTLEYFSKALSMPRFVAVLCWLLDKEEDLLIPKFQYIGLRRERLKPYRFLFLNPPSMSMHLDRSNECMDQVHCRHASKT